MFDHGRRIPSDQFQSVKATLPSEMYKADFMQSVITALESKLAIREAYPSVSNRELATY